MTFAEEIHEMDDDIAVHLGGEVESVVYQPAIGGLFNLTGIFDRGFVKQEPFESVLDNRGPSVFLSGAEVAKLPTDPRQDDPTITIRGQEYQAKSVVNDGPASGGRRIMLSEVG